MTCGICGRERPYCPSCAVDGEKERLANEAAWRAAREVLGAA